MLKPRESKVVRTRGTNNRLVLEELSIVHTLFDGSPVPVCKGVTFSELRLNYCKYWSFCTAWWL